MKNLLLSFTFLLSLGVAANSPITGGDKLTAKAFNNQSFTIGDIKHSLLTVAQFQTLMGDCWVKMQGQDITGSDYAVLTGKTLAPNTEGRFLRDAGGNAPALGTNQGDAIRNITGYFSAGQYHGYDETSGAFYQHSTDSKGYGDRNDSYRAGFDASRVVPTAAENRPINTSVNLFLKINHKCN